MWTVKSVWVKLILVVHNTTKFEYKEFIQFGVSFKSTVAFTFTSTFFVPSGIALQGLQWSTYLKTMVTYRIEDMMILEAVLGV